MHSPTFPAAVIIEDEFSPNPLMSHIQFVAKKSLILKHLMHILTENKRTEMRVQPMLLTGHKKLYIGFPDEPTDHWTRVTK